MNRTEFERFASMDRGISPMTIARYGAAMDRYINPTVIEERKLNVSQIENISRMMTVDFILSGQEPELDSIRRMCQNETISSSKKKERARIGF